MKVHLLIISILIVSFCDLTVDEIGNTKKYQSKRSYQNVQEAEEFLSTNKLILENGYPCEVHHVTTEDGYVLELHRIPRAGAVPVILANGLLYASSMWIIMGPDKGFAYLLYDEGYDVWLVNTRGNTYSRNHTTLSTSKAKFWDFTFHEIGIYDIPATIDYILQKTGFQKLQYIGQSMGATSFFIMCTLRPEYNSKIVTMQSLSSVVFARGVRSPVINLAAVLQNQIFNFLEFIGWYEFLPSHGTLSMFIRKLCKYSPRLTGVCENVMFLMFGFNADQLNSTMLPVIFDHIPAGGSLKQVKHFAQLKSSGRFQYFDYGAWTNLQKYGISSPPEYDLGKVTTKVAIHYSANDWLSGPTDAEKLKRTLSNAIGSYLVDCPKFNHDDFLWAIDARDLLYSKVIRLMKSEEKNIIEKERLIMREDKFMSQIKEYKSNS